MAPPRASRIVFCNDPLEPRKPEPHFVPEVEAARAAGFEIDLIDHDALLAGRLDEVLRRPAPLEEPVCAVLRSWMMPPERYQQLHRLLQEHGRVLINSPAQYEHAHHLPASYAAIEGHTPRSIWMPVSGEVDFDQLLSRLEIFEGQPVIVKDYVKSQKHAWKEACFIPSAADRVAVERVVRRFLELQGADLNVGLVFRKFVPLESAGVHPRSGMPLSRELRRFVLDGEELASGTYWDESVDEVRVPPDLFADVARRVESRFYSMDLARTADGRWIILELGDGQVAGLPQAIDPGHFYRALAQRLSPSP